MGTKKIKVRRDAISGEFTTKKKVEKNPKTTTTETRTRNSGPKPKKK